MPASIDPVIDGQAIAAGDEIAVFTPRGTCAGVGVWNEGNLGITVWGDDLVTEEIVEGFKSGEALSFRVWDASTSIEYGENATSVVVAYSSESSYLTRTGQYRANAVYELSSLRASRTVAPPRPVLPADGSVGITAPVTLSWFAVSGGHSYEVQVSTSPDFQGFAVERKGVIGTSVALSSLSIDKIYYWRVRAVTATGIAGEYSEVFRFSTYAEAPGIPSPNSPSDGAISVSLSATLTWESAPEAHSYDLQVSTHADFATINVRNLSTILETKYVLRNLREGQTYYWRVRSVNTDAQSAWTRAYSFTTIATQEISMASGWNMVSSYIEPEDASFEAVLAPIASTVVLAKDGDGGIYWPDQGLHSISTWDARRAYTIFVAEPSTLSISGAEVPADRTSISLTSGWNSVAFWGRNPAEVSRAVDAISDAVVAVKNVNGEIYVPGEEVQTLNVLEPNAGYMIYVSYDAELTYSAPDSTSASAASLTAGFAASASVIIEAPAMADGDILVARRGLREIGRATILEGRAVLVLKGDDPITDNVDGAVDGDRFTLAKIDGSTEEPLVLAGIRNILHGTIPGGSELVYGENAILSVQVEKSEIPTEPELAANYPNPFKSSTNIPYTLTEASEITLTVYNILGQHVATLVDERREAGRYQIRFDAGDLTSGSYIYRLQSGGFVQNRQMIVAK